VEQAAKREQIGAGSGNEAGPRPPLDTRIHSALAAESDNAPDAAALRAQADQTATDQAPEVPLTTNTDVHLVSARVGNYQYSFATGVLLDQLWVH
jgi:hypothetical protein